ncbi:MAG: SsrA-binding protein SmpB [Bdellovibrionota bacterium]
MTRNTKGAIKVVAENRKASFNYELLERFEAGLVLRGAEIKALREGKISLQESYIRVIDGELYLLQAHISEYSHSNDKTYDPVRKRKLLMHKKEILKLGAKVETKGLTLVPVKVYLKNGFAKLDIALARGKKSLDKREAIKEREQKIEASRALKYRR